MASHFHVIAYPTDHYDAQATICTRIRDFGWSAPALSKWIKDYLEKNPTGKVRVSEVVRVNRRRVKLRKLFTETTAGRDFGTTTRKRTSV